MKLLSAVAVSLLLICSPPIASLSAVSSTDAGILEAQTWLNQIDAGGYSQSWQTASSFFRNAISKTHWTRALQATRSPLGALNKRIHQTSQPVTSLPGAPDGEYCILTFATEFAKKKEAVETVTVMHEADGQWRVAGYFIK